MSRFAWFCVAYGLAWTSGYLYGAAQKRRIGLLVFVQNPPLPQSQDYAR